MHKMIFFPERKIMKKNVCLPYLNFLDPLPWLPETHLFCYLAYMEWDNDNSTGFLNGKREIWKIFKCPIAQGKYLIYRGSYISAYVLLNLLKRVQ